MFSKLKEVVKNLFGIGNSSSESSFEDYLDEPRDVPDSSFEEELNDLGDPEVVSEDLLDDLDR